MNLILASSPPPAGSHAPGCRAFTLSEFMVTAAIFFIVIGGVIYAHIFGLKMVRLTEMASDISTSDRRLLQKLSDEITTAKSWDLGNGSAATFSRLSGNRLQQANSLQIYPTTNSSQYVRYYLTPALDILYRTSNNSSAPEIVAQPVINSLLFSTEDGQGNILSNRVQDAVLGLNLQLRDYAAKTWGTPQSRETHWLRAKLKSRATD